jgi:hypothetical protein
MPKDGFTKVKIGKGIDEVFGSEGAERFHLSSSKNNAPEITINDFELGVDKLHYGKVASTGYDLAWIDADNDGEANDLEIVMGDQTVILADLADQLQDPLAATFYQGFEDDTAGVFDADNGWQGAVTQVASGTDGITSASGDYHAVFEQGSYGPYTDFGGYEDSWQGGWTTSVTIYLDTSADGSGWALGEGFDYSSAANGSDGAHQRDYIFHVTMDTSSNQLLINASNNTNFDPREDLDTLSGTAVVSVDGWYTFQQVFYEDNGVLAVDMLVYDESDTLVFSTTLSDPSDVISEIGGNRYGWFTNIDVDGGIAVDDLYLTYEANELQQIGEEIFW